jgi:ABC-type Na+ efflux pump permease subunit
MVKGGRAGARLRPNAEEMLMSLITVFVMVAALFAAISLVQGVTSMAHGGAQDQQASHWIMFKRVGWQALALLFILMALFSSAA